MLRIIMLSAILLAAAMILMAVKVLLVKGGRFPSGHVHDLDQRRRQAAARRSAVNNQSNQKPLQSN